MCVSFNFFPGAGTLDAGDPRKSGALYTITATGIKAPRLPSGSVAYAFAAAMG
jgi:hypothetical protein